ncbi:MAG: glycosyltransferase [Actinobacteria bacterium]|nr:glycosyltransferase [Actinomycetota bacterium]
MRILQVVTLLSPDGAYGGPVRVAMNQSRELLRRGHDVTILATTRGYPQPPTQLQGVPLKLFAAHTLIPHTGFAGTGSLSLRRWIHSNLTAFDITHIHLARDLVVLPVAVEARRIRTPYVLQTHGMVVPSRHPLAAPLDAMWTRKVLTGAGALFYLTPTERAQLLAVARSDLRLRALANGVPDYPRTTPSGQPPEVLFVARLHRRKRPLAFVEMAKTLLAAGVQARFTLIGPDGGDGAAVRLAIGGDPRIVWQGPLAPDAIPERMASASVYVLPSVDEPYPMSVLEAMSVGVPVVICADCGLAGIVARTGCGVVVNHEIAPLAAAVAAILDDTRVAREMGDRARAAAHDELGMQSVADSLLDTYAEVVDRQ